MNGYNFSLALIILAIIAALIFLANGGSLVATALLAVLATVLLVCVGAMITLLTQRMANRKAQADFMENAKENMAIMGAMQRVQNQQNTMLQSELGKVAKLPERTGPAEVSGAWDLLMIEDEVFNELDNG